MTQKTPQVSQAIERIIINAGVGKLQQQAHFEDKMLPAIEQELAMITGQKPSRRPAKKSIAGFKVREGDVVGLKVTLRGKRMNDFLQRLIHVSLPRIRDFKGIALSAVDESGNLNIGLRDQYIFPEINVDKSQYSFSLQVTLVTSLQDRDEAIDFYRSIQVPLKRHG